MRRSVLTEDYSPPVEIQDANATFALLLTADQFPANPFSLSAPLTGGHDLSLSTKIRTNALRAIVEACLWREPITLIYLSKKHKQEMVFSPSALVMCSREISFQRMQGKWKGSIRKTTGGSLC